MFSGRYAKGELVQLGFACVDVNDIPAFPDAVPSLIVYSDSAIVETRFVPCEARYVLTGYFQVPLQISSLYSTGRHRAVFNYTLSGTTYFQTAEFEVLGMGDADGAGIALHVMDMPHADYALMLSEQGRIKRMRNPRSV